MSSRISKRAGLAAVALLAACQSGEDGQTSEGARRETQPLYCAVGPGTHAAPDCRLEIVEDADSRVLILSLPHGAFRRVRVAQDGTLSAADGALDARTARVGDFIGVVFGAERYAVPVRALGLLPPQ